jgi:hypothetical protein
MLLALHRDQQLCSSSQVNHAQRCDCPHNAGERAVWPWEQLITVGVNANLGTARKIRALRSTDVFWPWQLICRDFLQPVWKQQVLFKLFRRTEERRMEHMSRIGFTKQYRQYYLNQLKISLVRCIVFQQFIACCNLCPLLV